MATGARDHALPIKSWRNDMRQAAENICASGRDLLEEHRRAGGRAATAAAANWKLESRLDDERGALERLIVGIGDVLESIQSVRSGMHPEKNQTTLLAEFQRCARTIARQVPEIERELIAIRHIALDLLLWSQRAGYVEDSPLPEKYRASYAELISYTPVFKPMLEAMREELVSMCRATPAAPELTTLISALNHYNAVAASARSFVRNVVHPSKDLVFHDTHEFLEDFQKLAKAERAAAATELNDCCQFLLYAPDEFHRRVAPLELELANGMEASLFVLAVDANTRIIFTVDDDPVFERIEITLLRAVSEEQTDTVIEQLTRALYSEFLNESDQS